MTERETQTDRLVRRAKDNPLLAFLIVGAVTLVGIATLTDAIDKLMTFGHKYLSDESEVTPAPGADVSTTPAVVTGSKAPETGRQLTNNGTIVANLLRDAEEHLAAIRLTTPQGENAYETYHRVLELDANNDQASLGLKRIAERYVDLARVAIDKRDLSRAERYLEKAEAINPTVTDLEATRRSLEEAGKLAESTAGPTPDGHQDDPVSDQSNTITASKATADEATQSSGGNEDTSAGEPAAVREDSTSRCATDELLIYALAAAAEMFRSTKRDKAYRTVADGALCSLNYEIAIQASKGIFLSTARDEAYMEIVKSAIEGKQHELANKVARNLFSRRLRDRAKQMIVDSASNQ
jgi:tetratricopeptide (TPR) repeat protein